MTVSHTPLEVSASTAEAPTFVAFDATVRNAGNSKLTRVVVTACLVAGSDGETCAPAPPGASFHSAASSAGACTIAGATVRCELGFLKRGTEATIELVARAPVVAGSFRNLISVSAKEQDTITVSQPVTTLALGGPSASSFVPEGTATQLLAADEGQSGLSKIPAAHDALTAELAITDDPPFVCPKSEICRGGGWVSATIPGAFDALQFVLHWPDEFVSKKQTEEELRALLHRLRHVRARDHPRPLQVGDAFGARAAVPLEHPRPEARRLRGDAHLLPQREDALARLLGGGRVQRPQRRPHALHGDDVVLPLEAPQRLGQALAGAVVPDEREHLGQVLQRVGLENQGVRSLQELDGFARELLGVPVDAPPRERLPRTERHRAWDVRSSSAESSSATRVSSSASA